jgi:hypothetical protein
MAGQTLHGDICSVALDDTLADREAKSGAIGFFGALVCALGEFLENPFMLFQGNAGAIVNDIIRSLLPVMMTGFFGNSAGISPDFAHESWPVDHRDARMIFTRFFPSNAKVRGLDSRFAKSSIWLTRRVGSSVSLIKMFSISLSFFRSVSTSWQRISKKAHMDVRYAARGLLWKSGTSKA